MAGSAENAEASENKSEQNSDVRQRCTMPLPRRIVNPSELMASGQTMVGWGEQSIVCSPLGRPSELGYTTVEVMEILIFGHSPWIRGNVLYALRSIQIGVG